MPARWWRSRGEQWREKRDASFRARDFLLQFVEIEAAEINSLFDFFPWRDLYIERSRFAGTLHRDEIPAGIELDAGGRRTLLIIEIDLGVVFGIDDFFDVAPWGSRKQQCARGADVDDRAGRRRRRRIHAAI